MINKISKKNLAIYETSTFISLPKMTHKYGTIFTHINPAHTKIEVKQFQWSP
jgi:hypothetical protein